MTQITKTAVDANSREYWEKYFGPYGKMWTRNIGKRVKAALAAEMTTKAHRQAAAGAQINVPRILSGSAAPLAHSITDAGVTVEGVFRGEIEGAQGKPARFARVFKASWNHDGVLTSFRSVEAP